MSGPPLLDTHAWIWWLHGNPRLGLPALKRLAQFPHDLHPAISAISLWEVALLVSLGRLTLHTPLDAWLAIAADPGTVRVIRSHRTLPRKSLACLTRPARPRR